MISEAAARAYEEALAPFWHPLVRVEDLGDGPHGCELLGRPLTVCRMNGELACLDDVCRHFGASLSLGEVTGSGLRCHYHGWTYARDGRCVDIPARRGLAIPREARVRSYPVQERYGGGRGAGERHLHQLVHADHDPPAEGGAGRHLRDLPDHVSARRGPLAR
ncbi:Rieske 2Fe-2S domain-containing protein, partial [Candidatus Nephthysia bennettiae]|nr:Rieske 2Fe-2S domain-containing protein [Candidatus Dormibacteraeota bacterium]